MYKHYNFSISLQVISVAVIAVYLLTIVYGEQQIIIIKNYLMECLLTFIYNNKQFIINPVFFYIFLTGVGKMRCYRGKLYGECKCEQKNWSPSWVGLLDLQWLYTPNNGSDCYLNSKNRLLETVVIHVMSSFSWRYLYSKSRFNLNNHHISH